MPGKQNETFFENYARKMSYQYKDLAHCEAEPIVSCGCIQPVGYLFACDKRSMRITAISENAFAECPYTEAEIFTVHISQFVLSEMGEELSGQTFDTHDSGQTQRVLFKRRHNGSPVPMIATIYSAGESIVFELEPDNDTSPKSEGEDIASHALEPAQLTKQLLRRLDTCKTVEELAAELAHHVQFASGYERVLVYQFDAQWCGQVIAEVLNTPNAESFLGLRFPASDIPEQVRALYLRTKFRSIADSRMLPAAILTQAGDSAKNLDLSDSLFRAASLMHVRYMHNMGVRAAFSIPIVVNQKLWGLVSCHHYSGPKHPRPSLRSISELATQLFTARLLEHIELKRTDVQRKVADVIGEVFDGDITPELAFQRISQRCKTLLETVGADGIYLRLGERSFALGATPSALILGRLLSKLSGVTRLGVWNTPNLTSYLKGSGMVEDLPLASEPIAGVMALPITQNFSDCLMWFRKEQLLEIDWGGDQRGFALPPETLEKYTPRKSFSSWKETVSGESRPWLSTELETAHYLMFALLRGLLRT
jgi:light-regulated signal transduction histidine kinase (bacteriophytochrome)